MEIIMENELTYVQIINLILLTVLTQVQVHSESDCHIERAVGHGNFLERFRRLSVT